MTHSILHRLQGAWKSLIATDVLFKMVAFILLTPLVGLLFRVFLAASGRTILADVDIARFLLHPVGWLTSIVVGGAVISLLALEQSALMSISLAAAHGKSLGAIGALRFVAGKAHGVFRIAATMVARLLLLSAPLLASGGAVYAVLLTDRDINFYLAEKPPRFWLAVSLIGTILAILAVLMIRCVVNWSVAMQLYLFENVSPQSCLSNSKQRVLGHRKTITQWVVVWWLANALMGTLASGLVLALAQWIVPAATASLGRLAVVLGGMVALWSIVNLACNLLAVISFALLQMQVYERCGRSDVFQPPGTQAAAASPLLKFTRGRVVAALVAAMMASATIGILTLRTVRLEDHVEITAHRAGAGRAPENTLAAVHQAIEDGADWIEIDVQESQDGVVVVIHDSDLARVAGVHTKIWAATADQLRAHDIGSYFDRRFADERIPTLAEVLEVCRGTVRVNIELKFYGHDVELAPKVIALVEEYEMVNDVVIMSLQLSQIQQVQRLRPDWRVGLLTAVSAGDLTRANVDFLAVSAKLATPAFVQRAHARDRDVHAWTINDAVAMSTMISRGVDNIITDYPDIARRVLEERAALSPTDRMLIELAARFGIVPQANGEQ